MQEPIPAAMGREAGTGHQSVVGLTQRDRQAFTLIFTFFTVKVSRKIKDKINNTH